MTEPTDSPAPPDDRPVWAGEFPATSRAVMRGCGQAALATGQRDAGAWPYPSLVLTAFDPDGSPLLLISNLADHTRNLAADDRAGLLFDGTAGLAEPLTGPRVSVLGRMAPTDDPRHRARFLARHPSAAMYAGFGDFRIWRMRVERAHLVAGFGRIRWIPSADLLLPEEVWRPLSEREGDIVAHMNEDHADAIALFATVLLRQQGSGWRMTGIDPDGCDLTNGTVSVRLPLHAPVSTADQARAELVRMVGKARGTAGKTAAGQSSQPL